MRDLKAMFLTLFLTVLLLPVGVTFAQEEDIPLEEDETLMYQSDIPEDDFSVTIQEGMPEIPPIPYDDINNMIVPPPTDPGQVAGLITAMAVYSVFFGVLGLVGYIFTALAFQKIGKEMNYKNSWFAWVPILQNIMMFELGEQNPWLLLLFLIPGIGQIVILVFIFIALMNINEKRGYDKVLAVLLFVPFGMYILFYLLAWKPKTVVAPSTPIPAIPETK